MHRATLKYVPPPRSPELMIVLLKNRGKPKDSYVEEFTSRNQNFSFFPVLEHSYVDAEGLTRYLHEQQNQADALIVTSQRAIEALNEYRGDADGWLSKPVYTVGPATAEVVNEAGFRDIRGGIKAGDGSILSDIILRDREQDPSLKKFIFLTGRTRRDIIPVKLNASNDLILEERIVYETRALNNLEDKFCEYLQQLDASGQNGDHWVVFFSPSGSDPILSALKQMNTKVKLAAIGPTTYDYLTKNGFTVTAVAEKPHAPSLALAMFG